MDTLTNGVWCLLSDQFEVVFASVSHVIGVPIPYTPLKRGHKHCTGPVVRELVAGPALVGDVGPEVDGEPIMVSHEIVVLGRRTEEATSPYARVDLDSNDILSVPHPLERKRSPTTSTCIRKELTILEHI